MVGPLAGTAAPGSARRVAVDALLGTFARDQGIPFAGAGQWLKTYQPTGPVADQVHLTRTGHGLLALAFADRLRSLDLPAAEAIGLRRVLPLGERDRTGADPLPRLPWNPARRHRAPMEDP